MKRRKLLPCAVHLSTDTMTLSTTTKIQLTNEEHKLFETLMEVTRRFKMATTVRVAGGWVRDKILGKESHDIDIALDDMTGLQFAEKVNEHLTEMGVNTRRIGVIQANPEQSKHLETAACTVMGMSIDLVNLRSEQYDELSRIPNMRFGSPLEDATRRDFTINSLFYNINMGQVEDFTGKGLEDLKVGLIRTPLPPSTTFQDDPLRMLRAIRFATRFGFDLDSDIKEAFGDISILQVLRTKISRERIGVELNGMLQGANAGEAMRYLQKFNLAPIIFSPVSETSLMTHDWSKAVQVTEELLCADLKEYSVELVCLVGMFSNHVGVKALNSKKVPEPFSMVVIRDFLMFKLSLAQQVSAALEGTTIIVNIASKIENTINLQEYDNSKFDEMRLELGRFMWDQKDLFRISIMAAIACHPDKASAIRKLDQIGLEIWKLEKLWENEALCDGRTLMSKLKIEKGPVVGILMNMQRDWFIMNSTKEKFDIDECILHLDTKKEKATEEQMLILKKKLEDSARKKAEFKLEKAKLHQAHLAKLLEAKNRAESELC